jgi:hypothetical protein
VLIVSSASPAPATTYARPGSGNNDICSPTWFSDTLLGQPASSLLSVNEPNFHIVAIAPLQRLLCQEQHFRRITAPAGASWATIGSRDTQATVGRMYVNEGVSLLDMIDSFLDAQSGSSVDSCNRDEKINY